MRLPHPGLTFRRITLLSISLLCCAPRILAEEAAVLEPISADKIREHVEFLAADELLGRDSGEPGLEVAAEYLANQFRSYGLEPAGDAGTYFHHFTIPFGAAFGRGARAAFVDADGRETHIQPGARIVPFGYSESGRVDAPIVFAGYGLKTGEDEKRDGFVYDDFSDIDVRGKAVIVLRFLPRLKTGFAGGRRNPLASLTTKLRMARERGAAAVIFVTPPVAESVTTGERALEGIAHRAAPRHPTLPSLVAEASLVDDILARTGRDLVSIVRRIDETLEPMSFDVPGARIRFETILRTCTLRNVVARLPGTGDLAREAIVVGGHYDHIGRFGNQVSQENLGQIHNGADDNASGTAGVLELARVLAKGGHSPGRTILFMGFSGEELGLLGSKAWLASPRRFRVRGTTSFYPRGEKREAGAFGPGTIVESTGAVQMDGEQKGFIEVHSVQTGVSGWMNPALLERIGGPEAVHEIAAMVNMDMIGHGKAEAPVTLFGIDGSPELEKMAEEVIRSTKVPLAAKGKGPAGGGSDHESFASRGIPGLFFFTGMHKRYNTPDDDTATLDYTGGQRLLEVARAAISWLAQSPNRPTPTIVRTSQAGNPHGKVDLGVAVDGDFSTGARVSSTESDSPAQKAGIVAGDLIVAVQDQQIRTAADWAKALEAAVETPELELKILRAGKEIAAKVVLRERRGFGVSFGSVPDYGFSGRGVRFDDIRDGTAAQKAGVKPGDVLLVWGGKEVEDVEQWTGLLSRHKPGDEVVLVVERASTRVNLTVRLEARR